MTANPSLILRTHRFQVKTRNNDFMTVVHQCMSRLCDSSESKPQTANVQHIPPLNFTWTATWHKELQSFSVFTSVSKLPGPVEPALIPQGQNFLEWIPELQIVFWDCLRLK